MPDNVVRADALTQEAMRRNIYSLDEATNLAEMPGAARGAAPDIHGHFGSHPQYDKLVERRLDRLRIDLTKKYGTLDKIPDDVLLREIRAQEIKLRKLIEDTDESIPTRIDKETATKVLALVEDKDMENA